MICKENECRGLGGGSWTARGLQPGSSSSLMAVRCFGECCQADLTASDAVLFEIYRGGLLFSVEFI